MVTWGEFAASAPELALEGRRRFRRAGVDQAFLASVRGDGLPRLHPIWVGIVDDRLYAFLHVSAKSRDLDEDGRYALHAHQEPASPTEFELRGRAHRIDDPAARSVVAAGWAFEVDDGYQLYEFDIESALIGARPTADDWPPRYTAWRPDRV